MSPFRTALTLAGAGLALAAPGALAQSTAPAVPALPDDVPVAEGSAIVRFQPGTADAARDRTLAAAGVRLVDGIGLPDAWEVAFPEELDERAVARELASQPGVAWAEPDVVGEVIVEQAPPLELTPADASFGQQWSLDGPGVGDLGARRAWGITEGGGALVAVIDVGVDFAHPQLAGVFHRNPGEDQPGLRDNGIDDDGNGYVDDWRGYDFGSKDADPTDNLFADRDEKGHGTTVAGVIGARGDADGITGVDRHADLLAVKVANAKGNFTASKVAAGLVYAQRMGADVANVSLSIGAWTHSVSDAISYAKDVLVVAGAGNAGKNLTWSMVYPCESNHANVVCVAASGQDGRLTSWSNHGWEVDLAAPGDFQPALAFGGGMEPGQGARGTSIAAPQVAGTAALLYSMNPWIADPARKVTPTRARAAILDSVVPDPSLTHTTSTGGRLDAHAALRELDVAPPSATALPATGIGDGWAQLRAKVGHAGANLTNIAFQWRKKHQPAVGETSWFAAPLTRSQLDAQAGAIVTSQVLPSKSTTYQYRVLTQTAYGASAWSPWLELTTTPLPVDPDGPTEVAVPPKPTH